MIIDSDNNTKNQIAKANSIHFAICKGSIKQTALTNIVLDGNEAFINFFKTPKAVLNKLDSGYFLRCDGATRGDKTVGNEASLLILDGDSSIRMETGEVYPSAPNPSQVSAVLRSAGINHVIGSSHSNGKTDALGYPMTKYRVVIPCVYNRQQLTPLVDYLIRILHSQEVMLADVKENHTWAQAWFFPSCLPDKVVNFQFLSYMDGDNCALDVDAITGAWMLANTVTAAQVKKLAANRKELTGSSSSIKDFNARLSVSDVLLRNGYRYKQGNRYLHPNSSSGLAGAVVFTCEDGVERVYSHASDVLNDGYAHDAFDCYRMLEHGGDMASALWRDKPRPEPESPPIIVPEGFTESVSVESAPKVFKVVSVYGDLTKRVFKASWLINGIIEQGNMGLMFGKSGSLKSFMAFDMGFCIAAGLPWHGMEVTQGGVLYVVGEGFFGLSKRARALAEHYGEEPEGFHVSEQPAAFMDISSAAAVADAIKEIGNVVLVVIDTFHRNMGGGDENSSKDFGQFLNNIDAFIKPTGVAIMIIHHSGHDATERSRGSSAIRASMDVEYQMTYERGGVLELKNTKMKDYDAPEPMMFNPKTIDLGDGLNSLVLERVGYVPPVSAKKRLSGNDERVLSALRKTIAEKGVKPTNEIRNLWPETKWLIPHFVANIEDWRKKSYESLVIDCEDNEKARNKARIQVFSRSRNRLESLGIIGLHSFYAWPKDA